MREEQIVTGAPNSLPYVLADGYVGAYRFTAYACGSTIVFLSPDFAHIQSVHRPSNPNDILCIDCSALDGKLAVSHGNEVVVYKPFASAADSTAPIELATLQWREHVVLQFETHSIMSLSWDARGGRLLTGGDCITLWCDKALAEDALPVSECKADIVKGSLVPLWIKPTASPVHHLHFSQDGTYFVSAGAHDRVPKLWYPRHKRRDDSGATVHPLRPLFDFLYLPHPRAVSSLSWRAERPDARNALLTSCVDNMCRIWTETSAYEDLGFFCACVISSDFPESQTNAVQLPFVLHWLNFRSFTNPAERAWTTSASTVSSSETAASAEVHVKRDRSDRAPLHTGIEPDAARDIVGLNVTSRSKPRKSLGRSMSAQPSVSSLSQATHATATDKQASSSRPPGDLAVSQVPRRSRHKAPKTLTGLRALPKIKAYDVALPELLFFVRSDGSLAFWRVDGLDQSPRTHLTVKPLSRSPPVIPLSDAMAPCYRVLVHFPDMHGASRELLAKRAQQFRRLATTIRAPSTTPRRKRRRQRQQQQQQQQRGRGVAEGDTDDDVEDDVDGFPLMLELHHSSGVLAKWKVSFDPGSALSSVSTVECLARCSGHTAPVSAATAHPTLPCALTLAKHDSTLQMVLWKVGAVGVFPSTASANGLQQLARIDVSSHAPGTSVAFLPTMNAVAWVAPTEEGLALFALDCTVVGSTMTTPKDQHKVVHRAVQCGLLVKGDDSNTRFTFAVSQQHMREDGHATFLLAVSRLSPTLSSNEVELYTVSCVCLSPRNKRAAYPQHRLPIVGSVLLVTPPAELCVSRVPASITDDSVAGTTHLLALSRHNSLNMLLAQPWRCAWFGGVTAASTFWVACVSRSSGDGGFQPGSCDRSNAAAKEDASTFSVTVDMIPGLSLKGVLPCSAGPSALAFSAIGRLAAPVAARAGGDSDPSASASEATSSTNPGGNTGGGGQGRGDGGDASDGDGCRQETFCVGVWEAVSDHTSWRLESQLTFHSQIRHVAWCATHRAHDLLVVSTTDAVHVLSQTSSSADGGWVEVARVPMLQTPAALAIVSAGALLTARGMQVTMYSPWSDAEASSDVAYLSSSGKKETLLGTVASTTSGLLAHTPTDPYSASSSSTSASPSSSLLPCIFQRAVQHNRTLPWHHPCVLQHLLCQDGGDAAAAAVLGNVYAAVQQVSGRGEAEEDMSYIYEETATRRLREARRREDLPSVEVDALTLPQLAALLGLQPSPNSTTTATATGAAAAATASTVSPTAVANRKAAPFLTALNPESAGCRSSGTGTGTTSRGLSGGLLAGAGAGAGAGGDSKADKSSLFAPESTPGTEDTAFAGSAEAEVEDQDPLATLTKALSRVRLAGLTDAETYSLRGVLAAARELVSRRSSLDACGVHFLVSLCLYRVTHALGQAQAGGGSRSSSSRTQGYGRPRPSQSRGGSGGWGGSCNADGTGGNGACMAAKDFVWALHSEAQEVLLEVIAPGASSPAAGRGVGGGGDDGAAKPLAWPQLRAVGFGWWVTSITLLKKTVERVMKSAYKRDANSLLDVALFYVALGKTSLLAGLFRVVGDTRMSSFFRNDFSADRWRTASLKNAYALLSKQRFLHASAFFLLGGDLEGASNVLIKNLQDPQLALVVSRLCEDSGGASASSATPLQTLLRERLLPKFQQDGDLFAQHMALWHLREYVPAVDVLLQHRPPSASHTTASSSGAALQRGLPMSYPASVPAYALAKQLVDHSQVRGKRTLPPQVFLAASYAFAQTGQPLFSLRVLQDMDAYYAASGAADGAGATAAAGKAAEQEEQQQQQQQPKRDMQDMINSGTFSFDAFGFGDDDDFGGFGGMDASSGSQAPEEQTNQGAGNEGGHGEEAEGEETIASKDRTDLFEITLPWRVELSASMLCSGMAWWLGGEETNWQTSAQIISSSTHVLRDLALPSLTNDDVEAKSKDDKAKAAADSSVPTDEGSAAAAAAAAGAAADDSQGLWGAFTFAVQRRAVQGTLATHHLVECTHVLAMLEPALVPRLLAHISQQVYQYLHQRQRAGPSSMLPVHRSSCRFLAETLARCLRQLIVSCRPPACFVTPQQLVEWLVGVFVAVVLLAWDERNLTSLLAAAQRADVMATYRSLFDVSVDNAAQAAVALSKPGPLREAPPTLPQHLLAPINEEQFRTLDGLSDLDETEVGLVDRDTVERGEAWRYRWQLLEVLLHGLLEVTVYRHASSADIDLQDLGRTLPAMFTLVRGIAEEREELSTALHELEVPPAFAKLMKPGSEAHPAASVFRTRQLLQDTSNPFCGLHARRLWSVLLAKPPLLQFVEHLVLQDLEAPLSRGSNADVDKEATATPDTAGAASTAVSSAGAVTAASGGNTPKGRTPSATGITATPTTPTFAPSGGNAGMGSFLSPMTRTLSQQSATEDNSGVEWDLLCKFPSDIQCLNALRTGTMLVVTTKGMFEFSSMDELQPQVPFEAGNGSGGGGGESSGTASGGGAHQRSARHHDDGRSHPQRHRRFSSSTGALRSVPAPLLSSISFESAGNAPARSAPTSTAVELETPAGPLRVEPRPWRAKLLVPHPKFKAYVMQGESAHELLALKIGDDYVLGRYNVPKDVRVSYIGFDPLGSRLFAASSDGHVCFWHFRPAVAKDHFRRVAVSPKKIDAIVMVAPSVLAFGSDTKVQVLDMLLLGSAPVVYQTTSPDDGSIKQLHHSLEQHTLFCATSRGSVFLIDLELFQRVKTISLFDTSARAITPLTDSLMLGVSSDLTIKLFDISERQPSRTVSKLQSRAKVFSTPVLTIAAVPGRVFVGNNDMLLTCTTEQLLSIP